MNKRVLGKTGIELTEIELEAKVVEVGIAVVKGEAVKKEYMVPFLLLTQKNVDKFMN